MMRISDGPSVKPPQSAGNRMPKHTAHNKGKEQTSQRRDKFDRSVDKPATAYQDKKTGVDQRMIERLRQESDRAYGQLRQLVEQLLKRQGHTWERYLSGDVAADTDIVVDREAQLEAERLISEGAAYSPEAVSDRTVEFAEALAGGDPAKMEMLRDAVEEGFQAAAEALGGSLPSVSEATYDMVMDKLDARAEGV